MDSLLAQTNNNFELLFVDYGSNEDVTKQTEKLLASYPFVKYVYSDTRGQFWNRAHAINTGIKLSSGEIILISDIDLVFRQDFISSLNRLSFNKRFYTFKCYYLEPNINYSNITEIELKNTKINYVGLCAASKENLLNISGFDEYYMLWGGEDDDLYKRLESTGCEWHQMEVDEFPVFHQWHASHAPSHPTPWYLETINYLYLGNKKQKDTDFGKLVKTIDRTILNKVSENGKFKCFELYGNPWLQFNIFIIGFANMMPGEFGQFEFPIKPKMQLPRGRKQKVIDGMNIILKKWDFPYSMEKKVVVVPDMHTRERWNEFVNYFVGKNRAFLADYYLLNTEKKLVLYFQKK